MTKNDVMNQMMIQHLTPDDGTKVTYVGFKKAARKLQIWWRKNILNVGYQTYENVLCNSDARLGLIFYEGFRAEILKHLAQPIPKTSSAPSGQMLTNLLRSEHIPYNIFFPMHHDMEGCRKVFNDLIGRDEIKSVDEIRIEYHPEPISNYLNDHTAFDVFIAYTGYDNKPCGIGIEVKYTEKEYPLKKDSMEYSHVKDENGKTRLSKEYRQVTDNSGWFKEGVEDELVSNTYRQIWRNHILGAAMIENKDISRFYSVTLYPQLNVHFSVSAMPGYKQLLSDKGFDTCIPVTYERLFDLMNKYFTLKEKDEWLKYLKDRYILTALDCIT